jgi:hypothetical protein
MMLRGSEVVRFLVFFFIISLLFLRFLYLFLLLFSFLLLPFFVSCFLFDLLFPQMKEVSYVIFDEIHYMRDRERGVVWEESIILLPPNINLVFLSATLTEEDARQFSDWICSLKTRVSSLFPFPPFFIYF